MTFDVDKPAGWSIQRCQYISESYLDLFLTYVERQAVQYGGRVDAHTLRNLAGDFQKLNEITDPALSRSFSDCNLARLNQRHRDQRKDHLRRLLVEQFAALLVEKGGPRPSQGGLSYDVLPGFFHALALALGADLLDRYRRRCNEIVERLQAGAGDDFDWATYFSESEINDVLIEILASLSRTFSNFERRKSWFIDILNKERQSRPGAKGPGFSEAHFQNMASALFDHLKIAIDDNDSRNGMVKKFGRSTVAEIEIFLDNIS